MCAIDDAETADVWLTKAVRAAKAWQCYECQRRIETGETYQRTTSLYDGRWDRTAICAHCWAAGEWLGAVCGGWLQGGLEEELQDHWDEGYRSAGMARLILGMRSRWGSRYHLGLREVPDADAVRVLARQMMAAKVAA